MFESATTKTLYSTLIHPHLNYDILVWGFKMERLQLLLKQSLRIIANSNFYAHTDRLFKRMNILKVGDIFNLKQIIFYKKFIQGSLPYALQLMLQAQDTHHRSCHTSFFLKPPIKANTEIAKLCIQHSIPLFINNFNFNFVNPVRDISLSSLKNNFKKLLFQAMNLNA